MGRLWGFAQAGPAAQGRARDATVRQNRCGRWNGIDRIVPECTSDVRRTGLPHGLANKW
jgi:hypothetical protein